MTNELMTWLSTFGWWGCCVSCIGLSLSLLLATETPVMVMSEDYEHSNESDRQSS
jgi:hypothetical protein